MFIWVSENRILIKKLKFRRNSTITRNSKGDTKSSERKQRMQSWYFKRRNVCLLASPHRFLCSCRNPYILCHVILDFCLWLLLFCFLSAGHSENLSWHSCSPNYYCYHLFFRCDKDMDGRVIATDIKQVNSWNFTSVYIYIYILRVYRQYSISSFQFLTVV